MANLTHARDFLATEAPRLRNALASLDHILAATTDASLFNRIDQQAGFVLGELAHSIDRIRRAQTAVAAARALAEPVFDELAEQALGQDFDRRAA